MKSTKKMHEMLEKEMKKKKPINNEQGKQRIKNMLESKYKKK